MTNKEAIELIVNMDNGYNQLSGEDKEAVDMAIAALKAEPCEDAVNRKRLLSEIDALMQSPWFNNGKDDDRFTHYGYVERKEAVEIVRDLCVKALPLITPKPRWISVSEGLPEEEGTYLTITKNNAVRINHFYKNHGLFGYRNNVIAWMPLPEPYKEGESE